MKRRALAQLKESNMRSVVLFRVLVARLYATTGEIILKVEQAKLGDVFISCRGFLDEPCDFAKRMIKTPSGPFQPYGFPRI